MKVKKQLMTVIAAILVAAGAPAAQNFVSEAGTVQYTNGGADISAGSLVDLGTRYGVAVADIASNETGTVMVDGIWSFRLSDTNAVTQDTALYFNSATNVTTTAAVNSYVGRAALATANQAAGVPGLVQVDLNALVGDTSLTKQTDAFGTAVTKQTVGFGTSLTVQTGSFDLLDSASNKVTIVVATNAVLTTANGVTNVVLTTANAITNVVPIRN